MKKINNVIDKEDHIGLIHSYQDACSNKEFKDYVDHLPIEEEILMKYTSSLEDAYKEFENCKNCKGLKYCKNSVKGYCYTPEKDQNIIQEYIPEWENKKELHLDHKYNIFFQYLEYYSEKYKKSLEDISIIHFISTFVTLTS